MSAETPTPHRAPADAQPSAEALAEAERILQRSQFNHQWGVTICDLALALDRFRAAGVREDAMAEALREIALLPDDHVYVRARGIAMKALNWSTIP